MTYERYAESNGNGGRSADEIQRDLGHIRGEIDHTLDALSAQLQPGQLLHQAWQSLRGGGGGRMLNNLSRTVQDNPLPLAMMAAGFGYLIYSDSKRREAVGRAPQPSQDDFDFEPIGMYSEDEGAEGVGGRLSQGAEGLKEGAKQRIKGLSDSATQAKEGAKQKLQHTMQTGRERAQQTRQWAGDKVDRAEDRARAAKDWGQNLIQEQPMILAGLGLAVGATLAALVPVSRKEHEVLGEAGQSIRAQAGAAAGDAMQKAKQVAEKAKTVASSALEAGKEEVASQASQSPVNDEPSSPTVASHTVESPGAGVADRLGATYAPTDPVSPGMMHGAPGGGSSVGSTETPQRQASVTLSYPAATLPSSGRDGNG